MSGAATSLRRFFKHSSIYAVGNALNRVAAILLLPVYTNYLGVAEYGTLEMFYVIAAVVASFLSMGIAHATLRFYFEFDSEPERRAVVSTNLIASFLISALGVSLAGLVHEEIARWAFDNPAYGRGVLLVLATLLLELSSQVCFAYFRAREYSTLFVTVAFARLIVQIAANTYLVVFCSAGVEGVLFGNFLAVAGGWIFLAVFTIRQCGLRFERDKAVSSLKYSFPFLLSTLTALVSTNVDKVLINSLLSLQALGVYALALKFSMLLDNLIGEPFSRSYGAFRFSIMKNEGVEALHARIVRYLFLVVAATGMGIAYFTRDLLVIMSDKAYWSSADYLPLLLIAAATQVLIYPVQTGILYAKKTRHIFHVGLLGAATSVAANWLLIRALGLWGACLAQGVTALVMIAATHLVSQRYFRVHYDYGRLGIAVVLAFVFYLLSLPLAGQPLSMGVPAKLLLFAAFVAALLRAGATAEEREKLRVFLAAAFRRR